MLVVGYMKSLALLLIGYFTTIHQENELKNDIHTLVGCLLPSVFPGQQLQTNFLRLSNATYEHQTTRSLNQSQIWTRIYLKGAWIGQIYPHRSTSSPIKD
ncbi:hypothetical protein GmHk_20G057727 [Glycine max]|nr:hypothetical protein GmHk_20G057727 [Glycine max]